MNPFTGLIQSLAAVIEKQVKLLGQFNIGCVIVGGVAATLYGSEIPTTDIDICYARNPQNLARLADALKSVNTRLRGAPQDEPFIMDAETLQRGLNFTFTSDIGSLDLLGEVRGVGYYEEVLEGSVTYELFGYQFPVMEIGKLIIAKCAAGRPKDLITIPELEAIQEAHLPDRSDRN